MASTINATTSSGIVATADNTGTLQLQSAGTTSATFNTFGIGLGSATPSSGIGITFPAAQSASSDANTLDDYEEGTWTPVYSSGVTSPVYTGTSGRYVKVGRLVTFLFRVQLSSGSANSSQVQISGLPFTVSNAPGDQGGSAFGYNGGFFTSGTITMFAEDSTTKLVFYNFSGTQFVGTSASNILSTIHGFGHYNII